MVEPKELLNEVQSSEAPLVSEHHELRHEFVIRVHDKHENHVCYASLCTCFEKYLLFGAGEDFCANYFCIVFIHLDVSSCA